MKLKVIICTLVIPFLLASFYCYAGELDKQTSAVYMAQSLPLNKESRPARDADMARIQWDKDMLALEKAVEDITANMPLIISMRQAFGEVSNLEWGIPVGHQLPIQPTAVIRIIALTGTSVRSMCPRMVIEDTLAFDEYVRWMERSVTSLDTFIMKDPKEEAIRQECLKAIQESLATRESWKY